MTPPTAVGALLQPLDVYNAEHALHSPAKCIRPGDVVVTPQSPASEACRAAEAPSASGVLAICFCSPQVSANGRRATQGIEQAFWHDRAAVVELELRGRRLRPAQTRVRA